MFFFKVGKRTKRIKIFQFSFRILKKMIHVFYFKGRLLYIQKTSCAVQFSKLIQNEFLSPEGKMLSLPMKKGEFSFCETVSFCEKSVSVADVYIEVGGSVLDQPQRMEEA